MLNLSLNKSLIGVLNQVEKSMVQQNNVFHESLRQSVTVSKEHYLSNAKPCDGKVALDFSILLEDISRFPPFPARTLRALLWQLQGDHSINM